MNIPDVSALFADDNWNWPCSVDLLPPGNIHFTSENRGTTGANDGRGY